MGYILSIASLRVCGRLFSFLCLCTCSASCPSVPSPSRFFSPPTPAPSLCRTQKEGALLILEPPLGPSPAPRFGVAPAAPGFSNRFLEIRTSALSFRRLNSHQSCALGANRRTTAAGGRRKFLATEDQHSKRHRQRGSR